MVEGEEVPRRGKVEKVSVCVCVFVLLFGIGETDIGPNSGAGALEARFM
jgi:hypothetical protein